MTPPSAAELKACPFCGTHLGEPSPVSHPKTGLARIHPGSVEDDGCPLSGWGFYDHQLVAWNTRAIASQAPRAGEDEWRDLGEAPPNTPVIAQYRQWNRVDGKPCEHVVWFFDREWRPYPSTTDVAFADRWRPMPAAALSPPIQEAVVGEREPESAKAKAVAAMQAYVASAGVPLTEFDPGFVVRMMSAMMVSFHKYGRVADAYPLKFDAASDVRARMAKYRETGNRHFLVDAANFAMIEAMHSGRKGGSQWGTNDAADSPGRTTASGHRLVQEANDGSRIMGETILHVPGDEA